MAHHVEQFETGSLAIPTLPVSFASLLRHAEQFGTNEVYETAEMEHLPKANLVRLRVELDANETGRKSGGYTVGRRRKRGAEETRAAVHALSVEGLVPSAIADKLGLQDRSVRRYLRETGATAYESPSDVHFQAA